MDLLIPVGPLAGSSLTISWDWKENRVEIGFSTESDNIKQLNFPNSNENERAN